MSAPFKLLAPQDVLEAYYANLQRSETILMVMLDTSGSIIAVNRALAKLYACTPDELIGRDWFALSIPNGDHAALRNEFEHLLATGLPDSHRNAIQLPDGTSRTILWSNTLAHSGDQLTGTLSFGIDVSEATRKEEQLRIEHALLLRTEQIAGLGTYVLDTKTGIWTSSQLLDGIFGIDSSYPRTVDSWADLIHPDDRVEMVSYFNDHVLAQHQTFDRSYRILRKVDGAARIVQGFGKLDFDEAGAVVRMLGTIQDVTDSQKDAERAARAEIQLQQLIATIPMGIVIHREGTVVFANASAADILGARSTDELIGTAVMDRVPMEFHSIVSDRIRRAREMGLANAPLQEQFLRMDDSRVDVRVSNLPFLYDGKQSTLVTFTEIASPEESQILKMENEQRLRRIIDGMVEGFAEHEIITDMSGEATDYRFILVNPAFERITGLKKEMVIGKTVREIIPDIENEFIRRYGAVALTGQPDSFERQVIGLSGHTFRISAWQTSARHFATLFVDATESEKESRELSSIMDHALESIAIVTTEGVCTYQNAISSSMIGYEPSELIGKNLLALIHPSDIPRIAAKISAADTDQYDTVPVHVRIRHKNGQWIELESVAINLTEDASIRGILVFSRDVTAEHTARKAMVRVDELETLNQAMIGRELRIAELKKEIEQLRHQLEKSPK